VKIEIVLEPDTEGFGVESENGLDLLVLIVCSHMELGQMLAGDKVRIAQYISSDSGQGKNGEKLCVNGED
jgi:hypothetical protein